MLIRDATNGAVTATVPAICVGDDAKITGVDLAAGKTIWQVAAPADSRPRTGSGSTGSAEHQVK